MNDITEANKIFTDHLDGFDHSLKKCLLTKNKIKHCIEEIFSNNNRYDSAELNYCSVFRIYFSSLIKFLQCLIKYIVTGFFIAIFLYLFIISHNSVQKFVMRNCQNLIYPTMRTLRIWTLPILRNYEFLSDWHEEECLVRNPFYYELPLDCWPCENIRTLVDLSGFTNYSHDYVLNEQPFIVRDSLQENVSFQDLQKLYYKYDKLLDRGTAKFRCSEKDFCLPNDVFTKKPPAINTFHVMWKINRVAAARVIRKIFPRPYFIPNNSEVALERYLYLSGSEAPQFFLPLTDFANVWVAQGQGYRLIVLDPSEPCISNCSAVSVLLRPRDVLYYNWQFWRPRSRPANLCEEMSITFVGSFY
ncbi:uncharacterized protein [Parasteatoda tepidariorum]|nr:uncharacterized protein LOC107443802 isoform X2 [Parasteatoda tepidariorum]